LFGGVVLSANRRSLGGSYGSGIGSGRGGGKARRRSGGGGGGSPLLPPLSRRARFFSTISEAFVRAGQRFKANPREHLMIPLVAALVGWFTNWLAVEMIFFPLSWWGIPILRWPGNPFGLLGWQVIG